MILVVLVQGGNQGGVGAAFGGGDSQGVFGASGATSFLGKLTYAAAFILMLTTLSLAVLQGGGRAGLSEKLQKAANAEKAGAEVGTESPVDADGVSDTSEASPADNATPAEAAAESQGTAGKQESDGAQPAPGESIEGSEAKP